MSDSATYAITKNSKKDFSILTWLKYKKERYSDGSIIYPETRIVLFTVTLL